MLNGLQTALLIVALLFIGSGAGYILFGQPGFWLLLTAIVIVLLIEPLTVSRLTLSLYRARPIAQYEAPELWRMLEILARRAGLERPPLPYYVPSRTVNAFAVGGRRDAAIAMTDGLLARLTMAELAAVLAHETAHIANGDLRVMNLADYVSRLTGGFAMVGLLLIFLLAPFYALGLIDIEWAGLGLLALSPHLASLAQMGLSRVREFKADLTAARLTGDPVALASALGKVDQAANSWRRWLLPGWGNPDPSWLRSHPPTTQRIARLLALAVASQGDHWSARPIAPGARSIQRSPGWHSFGVWH